MARSSKVNDETIKEEERKLKEIRDSTHQRMRDVERRLEARIISLVNQLEESEKNLQENYRASKVALVSPRDRRRKGFTRNRVETLLKRRPSVEDRVYRGIYVDTEKKRASRELAACKVAALLDTRWAIAGSCL
jgi:hypothetical protein